MRREQPRRGGGEGCSLLSHECPEALECWLQTCGAFGQEKDSDLYADVKGVMGCANVTKASAVLLWFFKTDTEKDSLRDKVRCEIKSLRGLGFKEDEVLHPALAKRVALALAMRAG